MLQQIVCIFSRPKLLMQGMQYRKRCSNVSCSSSICGHMPSVQPKDICYNTLHHLSLILIREPRIVTLREKENTVGVANQGVPVLIVNVIAVIVIVKTSTLDQIFDDPLIVV
ncbi:hypothetical protein CVV72_09265 [Amycolatopsis sp. TNS106]|nr:hypothetical protein CVV72_09265 [Amycolatopsis sp. TNS106]